MAAGYSEHKVKLKNVLKEMFETRTTRPLSVMSNRQLSSKMNRESSIFGRVEEQKRGAREMQGRKNWRERDCERERQVREASWRGE